MRPHATRMFPRLAIVLLALTAAASPCTLHVADAAPSPVAAPITPRQLVTEPMVWMVPTATGWQPAEHAQPTLWLEDGPHTRYTVDRPGVERAFLLPQPNAR